MRTATCIAVLMSGLLAGLPMAVPADTPLPTVATFTVSAQVVPGCGIVGRTASSGLNFGTLDFGSHPAVATGRVESQARLGGAALQLECSPDSRVDITVDGGLHGEGGAQRNVQLAGGDQRIPYSLYSDAALSRPLAIGQPISLTVSGTIDLPIYGVLSLPGPGAPAGLYTDTVRVTLSY